MPSHSSDVCDINAEKNSAVWELSERFHVIFTSYLSILLVADLKLLIKSLDARVGQLILFAWSLPQFSSLSFLSSFIP